MRISESCAQCLYDRQKKRTPDADYLAEVARLLAERGEDDTSPLLVYRFNQAYARRFGAEDGYAGVKRRYNDLALGMEAGLRQRIEAADDPLAAALAAARVGNYIDYGAMDDVDEATFLSLFAEAALRPEEAEVYARFLISTDRKAWSWQKRLTRPPPRRGSRSTSPAPSLTSGSSERTQVTSSSVPSPLIP